VWVKLRVSELVRSPVADLVCVLGSESEIVDDAAPNDAVTERLALTTFTTVSVCVEDVVLVDVRLLVKDVVSVCVMAADLDSDVEYETASDHDDVGDKVRVAVRSTNVDDGVLLVSDVVNDVRLMVDDIGSIEWLRDTLAVTVSDAVEDTDFERTPDSDRERLRVMYSSEWDVVWVKLRVSELVRSPVVDLVCVLGSESEIVDDAVTERSAPNSFTTASAV